LKNHISKDICIDCKTGMIPIEETRREVYSLCEKEIRTEVIEK
jgi:hypothetical protein